MVEPKKEISVRIEAPSKGETHQRTREPLVSIGCGDSPPAVTGLTSMFQTLSLSREWSVAGGLSVHSEDSECAIKDGRGEIADTRRPRGKSRGEKTNWLV